MGRLIGHSWRGALVLLILLGGCKRRDEIRENPGAFEEVYGDLLNASSNQIQVATFNEFQFNKYSSGRLESSLLYDEAKATLSDSNALFALRLKRFKIKSLAYFRYYIGMSETARRCNDVVPYTKGLDPASAREAIKAHLKARNDCMFTQIGAARIDSLFKARPELNGKPYKCSVKMLSAADERNSQLDSFKIVFDGQEQRAPRLKRLICGKILSKEHAVHGADDTDSVSYSGRIIRFRMVHPEFDARYSYSLMPEKIFEAIYGDSINKASARSWETLKQREKLQISADLQSVNLKSDTDGVLARAGNDTILTILELKKIMKDSPGDTSYLGNLKSYIDFVGIWKLGSKEYDRLKLDTDPFIRNFVSAKEQDFLADYFRERIFLKKQKDSKPRIKEWLDSSWTKETLPCKQTLAEYRPLTFNMLGEIPFAFFRASLTASIVKADTVAPTHMNCFEKIHNIDIKAYETSYSALMWDLAAKHPATVKLFSPFLVSLGSYSDSLKLAQKAYELGNAGFAASILESLLYFNFSDNKKLCDLSLFLARINVDAEEFDKAAFQLERALLLASPSAEMEQPVKLLLAIYGKNLPNQSRSAYWKSTYSRIVDI